MREVVAHVVGMALKVSEVDRMAERSRLAIRGVVVGGADIRLISEGGDDEVSRTAEKSSDRARHPDQAGADPSRSSLVRLGCSFGYQRARCIISSDKGFSPRHMISPKMECSSICSPPDLDEPVVPCAREHANHRRSLADRTFPRGTPLDTIDVGDSVRVLLDMSQLHLWRRIRVGRLFSEVAAGQRRTAVTEELKERTYDLPDTNTTVPSC
jgi:hypothetical protein